jgi:SAM-dependent methyltransferase
MYPTEWVIRTLLGKYPNLDLDKSKYKAAKLLDLGFGDCRNMPLLANCGFDTYGVEISDEIIELANAKLSGLEISVILKKGSNTSIPFTDQFFQYVLACHSCYYVDMNTSFNDNLTEIARVLKPNGVFIASLPAPDNFILKECKKLQDGHVVITNDIYGLRNGYVFRTFEDEVEIEKVFSPFFKNITVCKCLDNFWGVQINFFIVVAEKK